MSSCSSSRNWLYDVFPSFSGEDVRKTFLSHFLKELDRKLISVFRDSEIQRSHSIAPELIQAIRSSKIAVVVFSNKYASSSWCLNELLEIVKCKEETGQVVIPVFYGLDPSHIRKQTGDFGDAFEKTCKNKTEHEKQLWQKALTDVANTLGFHSLNWDNEAAMIEEIASDVLCKLNLTPSKDFDDCVGIQDHIVEMSSLLRLESEEVIMVGIWGPSGIGKTTIARALFSRLSRHFQGSVFLDRAFISKSLEIYSKANPDDYNMKLHLQENFLSEILNKESMKINHLGAVRDRLKCMKLLIIVDDLDNQMLLDVLVGQTQWFGCGSRIIAITNDMHKLKAHEIDHIYKVGFPSKQLALEMFCQSAFRKNSPPKGFEKLASEVAMRAGRLPLGLKVLGQHMRGRNKEDWIDMLPRLRRTLDGKIEKALRVSYDGLDSKEDQAIFRHIACLFNYENINNIKLLLANSDLDVNIGIKTLVDKSLIHIRYGTIEMHCLLQEMGREIVRAQSSEPGEREFLVDSKDICDVLDDDNGTKKVLGIALDMDEIEELFVHEKAFNGMRNLAFLKVYTNELLSKKETLLHLPEDFDYLPPKLRLLSWDKCPLRCMPSKFYPKSLVELKMRNSKLEKLWEGAATLSCLKNMDLEGSKNLREVPDLSMATNLETLELSDCYSLVEVRRSSIQNLNKLLKLSMRRCRKLKVLPTGINLKSLKSFVVTGCSQLQIFPDISRNVSSLALSRTGIQEFPSDLHLKNLVELTMEENQSEKLWGRAQTLGPLMTMLSPSLNTTINSLILSDILSLVELPSSVSNLTRLWSLSITNCRNLETLPSGINLKCLKRLDLTGCLRLKSFPEISNNISNLCLNQTGIEEVPWWIENFSRLDLLSMKECNRLKHVSLNISKLECLDIAYFTDCIGLTGASWHDRCPMKIDTLSYVKLDFMNCFELDQEALLQQQPVFEVMILPGEKVPSYFSIQTTSGSSLAVQTTLSSPFFRFRACVLVDVVCIPIGDYTHVELQVNCRFRGENQFDSSSDSDYHRSMTYDIFEASHAARRHVAIFDYCLPLNNKGYSPLADVVVDIHFRLISADSVCDIKACGLRVFEDCPPQDVHDEEDEINVRSHEMRVKRVKTST
ncbi:hypothetical protein N665_0087s0003 [Sinapis alba]|nr:hypothetical protein N665_0087s0003 [Sinapis alba]